MDKQVFIIVFSLILLILCELAQQSNACCTENANGYCGDGSRGTPCCGQGRCNIFCCNCDGGCRRRSDKKRFLDLFRLAAHSALNEKRDHQLFNLNDDY